LLTTSRIRSKYNFLTFEMPIFLMLFEDLHFWYCVCSFISQLF